MAEFAPGIPAARVTQRLPLVTGASRWQLALQVHDARRAGKHFDLRLGDGQHAHSWALRQWPGPGEKRLAVQQPTHTLAYMGFSGRIASGYGAGQVTLARHEGVEVLHADDDHVRFNAYPGQRVEEYLLKRVGIKNWLLMNVTPTQKKSVPDYKPKFKEKAYGALDVTDPDVIVQAKLSGAHVLVDCTGDHARVYSYRQDKRLIQHTPKIPGFDKLVVPSALRGSMFRAELVVPGIPEQRTGGILNAGVWKSRAKQKTEGRLKLYLLDVVTWRGKDVEGLVYGDKLPMLDEALRAANWLHRPRTAFTTGAKTALVARVAAGKEKTTDEGVVAWNRTQVVPTKMKLKDDRDVYVARVFAEKGQRGPMAGGFEYSLTPSGPVVGRVGTGLSHGLKTHMLKNPGLYQGLKAKIRTQRQGGAYAPQKPVFKGWHLDQQLPEGVKTK